MAGLQRGMWVSLIIAVDSSYSQDTGCIHQRKKVDDKGKGQG